METQALYFSLQPTPAAAKSKPAESKPAPAIVKAVPVKEDKKKEEQRKKEEEKKKKEAEKKKKEEEKKKQQKKDDEALEAMLANLTPDKPAPETDQKPEKKKTTAAPVATRFRITICAVEVAKNAVKLTLVSMTA